MLFMVFILFMDTGGADRVGPIGGALAKGLVAAALTTGADAAAGAGAGAAAAGRKLAGGVMSDDVKPRGAEVESTVAAGAGGGNGGGVGAVGVRSPPMGGEGWVWGVEGWAGSSALAAVEGAGAAGAMSVGAGARRSSPDDPVDAAVGGANGAAARGVSPCGTVDRTGVSAGMTSSPDGAASAGVVASAGSGGI